jgi:GntR family carbon starvation induced transcriptional regulator
LPRPTSLAVDPERIPFERGAHPSLRAAIIDAIRDDLRTGLLPPGRRISVKQLQRRFGTGLSAIREALCQLVADGMVIAEDQRGFRAAPVSPRDLADLTRVRIEIECLAIRDAIANGDTEWEATLLAEFHRLSQQPSRDRTDSRRISDAYKDQHRRFHDALIGACTSDWIKRFHATLHHHSERYRELVVSAHPAAHVRDILAEHRAMMDAALARDADRAVELVREHISTTAAILARTGITAET